MDYVLGLDGGGTSTNLIALDLDGNGILELEAGSININGSSPEAIAENLNYLLERSAKELKKQAKFIVIGAAGLSNQVAEPTLRKVLDKAGYKDKYYLIGDQEAALYGAFLGKPGVLLISGTGSIAYGIDENKNTYRVGGYGHLLDDYGSAYSIGKDILSYVIQAYDRRREATNFTELVKEKLNIDTIPELISYVYSENRTKKDIADFARLLEVNSDESAILIQDKAVNSLYDILKAMAKQMQRDKLNLVFSGSVLLKNKYIRSNLIEKIKDLDTEYNLVEAKVDAATGAAILALNALKHGEKGFA